MLKLKQQPYNSVWISADSQEELATTFMRFQEYYESPNPNFKNSIFTIGQLRCWYSKTYGGDTYTKDWIGFNFPSKVLEPFRQGLFDPLIPEENNLLDLLRYRYDNFYIIGAQDKSVLRHELSHALYASNIYYKKTIDQIINKNKKYLHKAIQYILDKGYCVDVLNDELQAYITDNDDTDLIGSIDNKIIKAINRVYNKYQIKSQNK